MKFSSKLVDSIVFEPYTNPMPCQHESLGVDVYKHTLVLYFGGVNFTEIIRACLGQQRAIDCSSIMGHFQRSSRAFFLVSVLRWVTIAIEN